MALECIRFKMQLMKVNGRKVKNKAKAKLFLKVEVFFKEISKMI